MKSQSLKSTDEWERALGMDVRRLRIEHSLTQSELAHRANISPSAVKALESGRGSSLSTLIKVLRALDRSEWLDQLVPPTAGFSPLAVFHRNFDHETRVLQRVRHATKAKKT